MPSSEFKISEALALNQEMQPIPGLILASGGLSLRGNCAETEDATLKDWY